MNIISELVTSVKRNHGLEHATIHLLSEKFPGRSFVGHSDTGGFWLKGNVSPEDLTITVNQALTRLKNGEQSLAIHPNCGTNFLASGFAAAVGSAIALIGVGKKGNSKLERFPMMITLSSVGLIMALPLGPYLQKNFTTTGDMKSLMVLGIDTTLVSGKLAHRVKTVLSNE